MISEQAGCGAIMTGKRPRQERSSNSKERRIATDPAVAEFIARLERTMNEPEDKENMVRGERRRLIGILAFLTRFISRVSTSARLRQTVSSFLTDQIHHLLQLNEGIQSPIYKAERRVGAPADRYEIWNARRYVVAALECYLLAKPNVRLDDEIGKIAQKNPCLKRLIRNATAETRFRNVQLESAIKRWRKSFSEGTAPEDVQESWNRDNRRMLEKERSAGGWVAAGNNLLKHACDKAQRIVLPAPVGV
jgi:hypothetical protein